MAQIDFDLYPFFDGKHPDHQPIKLSVREQDQATYFAKKAFSITGFKEKKCKERGQQQQPPPAGSAPANPFYRPLPWKAERGSGDLWRTSSGPATKEAIGYCYDADFEHEGGHGDPDVEIGP